MKVLLMIVLGIELSLFRMMIGKMCRLMKLIF